MSAQTTSTPVVYKICTIADWAEASRLGFFAGSGDDLRDGFIHLSSGPQVAETARRYFTGQPGLVLVAFDASSLGTALRWEPSRRGALFPHLYAPLPVAMALWVRTMPLDAVGTPTLPEGV